MLRKQKVNRIKYLSRPTQLMIYYILSLNCRSNGSSLTTIIGPVTDSYSTATELDGRYTAI